MTYDPNYNYDTDEEDDAERKVGINPRSLDDDSMDIEEEIAEADDENDEYSDDDDMSWKVRRSAAKCLEAIIITRHESIVQMYKVVAPALISRFKGNIL